MIALKWSADFLYNNRSTYSNYNSSIYVTCKHHTAFKEIDKSKLVNISYPDIVDQVKTMATHFVVKIQ
jgi:hypothetical protein